MNPTLTTYWIKNCIVSFLFSLSKAHVSSYSMYFICTLTRLPKFAASNRWRLNSTRLTFSIMSPAADLLRICVLFPSSFLSRGHGSWLFNPITGDWWHQVQSCAASCSRDELGWRAVGQHRSVSVKQRPDKRKLDNRWALRSQHFFSDCWGPRHSTGMDW